MAHEVQAKLGTIDISNKDLIIDITAVRLKLEQNQLVGVSD